MASLGAGKRPQIRVTINEFTYRSSIAPMGGAFMLPLSAERRASAGDEVEVDIELDTEPREVSVPPDFAEALDQDAATKQAFDGLSYSQQLRHVLSVEQAKTAETRQKRIAKAISMLREAAPSTD